MTPSKLDLFIEKARGMDIMPIDLDDFVSRGYDKTASEKDNLEKLQGFINKCVGK